MSAAYITIEDTPNPEQPDQPAVDLRLVFSGGFNNQSGAHQAAQALLKLWDELMSRIGQPVIDPVVKVSEPMLAIPEGATAEQAEPPRIITDPNG